MVNKYLQRILLVALLLVASLGDAASLFVGGKFQAIGSDGLAVPGCQLYTYAAGTLTPLATYTNQSGGSSNANPVVCDAAGQADVWLGTSSYRMILKTAAGVTVWDRDNLLSPNGELAATDSSSVGAGLVGYIRAYGTAVKTTVWKWIDRQTVDAFDFMTVAQIADVQARTRTLDVTVPLQNAIAAAGATRQLKLGAGSFKVTGALSSAASRFHLRGEGRGATELYVVPTANLTVLTLGTSLAAQQSVEGISFYSDDSTYEKIAIDIVDTTGVTVRDIIVGGGVAVSGTSYWSGGAGGSTALRIRGREIGAFQNLYLVADKPIQISDNPSSSIDIDHFNFHNVHLIANAKPCVTIDSGVNLTQVSFTGLQSWVRGTYGLYWSDTTSVGVSNGLVIENLRPEQGTSPTAYSIYIAHNTGLQGLDIRNFSGGANTDRQGFYFRKVEDIALDAHYEGSTNEALNVDATVKRISIHGPSFWQTGSTASLVGQRLVWGAPKNPNTGALPPLAYYDEAADADRNEKHDGVFSSTSVSLANNATSAVGATGTTCLLHISTSEGVNALYALNGTNHTTTEISDPSGTFTNAAGGAASLNVYWSAGNVQYEIENKRGVTVRVVLVPIGSYTGI